MLTLARDAAAPARGNGQESSSSRLPQSHIFPSKHVQFGQLVAACQAIKILKNKLSRPLEGKMEAPCGSTAHPGLWVFGVRGGFGFPQQLSGGSPSRPGETPLGFQCYFWWIYQPVGVSKPVKIHSETGRDDFLSVAASQCCALTEDDGKSGSL